MKPNTEFVRRGQGIFEASRDAGDGKRCDFHFAVIVHVPERWEGGAAFFDETSCS